MCWAYWKKKKKKKKNWLRARRTTAVAPVGDDDAGDVRQPAQVDEPVGGAVLAGGREAAGPCAPRGVRAAVAVVGQLGAEGGRLGTGEGGPVQRPVDPLAVGHVGRHHGHHHHRPRH